MSRFFKFKKPLTQDIKNAPKYIYTLLDMLHDVMDEIDNILDKKISIDDHIDAKNVTISHISSNDLPYKLKNPLQRAPKGIIKTKIEKDDKFFSTIGSATDIEWSYRGGDVIIETINGISAGVFYNLSILII